MNWFLNSPAVIQTKKFLLGLELEFRSPSTSPALRRS